MHPDKLREQNQFGKDYLTYLCYKSDVQEGLFEISKQKQCHVWVDGKIVLEDAGDPTPGTIVYTGDSFSTEELKLAIRSGKKVSEVRLRIEQDESTWSFTLRAERLDISNLRIYPPASRSDDLEGRFYSKILGIEQLHSIIDELYYQFLNDINETIWETTGYKIFQRWLNATAE